MKIYKDNTFEYKVWNYHMDGWSITEISEKLNKPYERIKDIVLEGWRLQDPDYNQMVYGNRS